MTRVVLTLRTPPALRVDLSALQPALLASGAAGVAATAVWHGNEAVALGDLFDVADADGPPELVLAGDLRRFDRIGAGLQEGTIRVDGAAGDAVGIEMSGGHIVVTGDAGDGVGLAMRGGAIDIGGSVGERAGGALPGAMDGMRGGTLVVRRDAGARCADRMRRGTLWVHGDVGDFAASRMVAGTLAIGGAVGAHLCYGMRRGTVVLCSARPAPGPTFVPADYDFGAAWALLRGVLARAGGPFATLPRTRPRRHAGDLAAGGFGELLTAAAATA